MEALTKNLSIPLTIEFSSDLRSKVKLLEITPDLAKLVESGTTLQIKGSGSEEAVLCTDSQTFSLKRVETSNSVYLVPPSSSSTFSVFGTCNDFYELKPSRGKTDKVKDIFESLVKQNVSPQLIKSDLIRMTQASANEIEQALAKAGIVELDGTLRLIPKELVIDICRDLFGAIILNSWKLSAVSEDELLSSCNRFDVSIVKHLLSKLGQYHSETKSWELDRKKIARQAVHILFAKQKVFTKGDFQVEWCLQSPELDELASDASLLKGIVVEVVVMESSTGKSKQSNNTTHFHYLPAEDLPSDIHGRLELLFQVKAAYSLVELEPYFSDLIGGPGQPKAIAEILLANTRLVDGLYRKK